MEDPILIDAMFTVTDIDWKLNNNYLIGQEIEQTSKMLESNGICKLPYTDALNAMVRKVRARIPSSGSMTYLAKPLYTMAVAYTQLVPSKDAKAVMGDLYKSLNVF